MATNIPPHNLGEIVDALCALIHNPNASVSVLFFVLVLHFMVDLWIRTDKWDSFLSFPCTILISILLSGGDKISIH